MNWKIILKYLFVGVRVFIDFVSDVNIFLREEFWDR